MESGSTSDVELFDSSFYGDIEGVIAALAQGGRVTAMNQQGFTPLLVAARNGHADTCGLLLAHGSNVNEVKHDTEHTALHLAASRGHNASVEALLSWGAEVNPHDHAGWTPLSVACQQGHLQCILTLLKAYCQFMLQPHVIGWRLSGPY